MVEVYRDARFGRTVLFEKERAIVKNCVSEAVASTVEVNGARERMRP